MEERSRSALKEWAAIERILATGSSIALLRKGGIWERHEGFEVEHREFWIFPTYFHQNPHQLAPEFAGAAESVPATPPDPDSVRLEHYAVVTDAFRVRSLGPLQRLAGLQPLGAATVESRFHYRSQPLLYVLLLRLHRLARPHVVPNTLDYEGCISWVTLEEELPTAGAAPVLDDAAYGDRRATVLERLGAEASVEQVL